MTGFTFLGGQSLQAVDLFSILYVVAIKAIYVSYTCIFCFMWNFISCLCVDESHCNLYANTNAHCIHSIPEKGVITGIM